MKTRLLLVMVLVSFLSLGLGTSLAAPPLPDDIKIVPPADNIPSDIREFFGTTGKWGGECLLTGGTGGKSPDRTEVRVYFEEISMNEANVIFATQGSTMYGMPRAYSRENAKIKLKGKRTILFLPMPSSNDRLAVGKFWIDKGILKGERWANTPWGAFTSHFTLKPID